MARIRFNSLTCEQTQDTFGPDEAFMAVFVDGEYVGNIFRQLSTGQTLALGFALEFQNEIRVQLWEIDDPAAGNPHDFLGELQIGAGDAATSGVFDRAGGLYRLDFEVQPDEEAPVPAPTLVLRKNEANMTPVERQRFLDALTTLIGNGTYGEFVRDHAGPAGNFEHRNHGFAGPFGTMRFLPWHRAYLINLERALQNVDPSVFIPYWRWTVNRGVPGWLDNFTPDVPMPDGSTLQVVRGPPATFPLPTLSQVNSELSNASFSAFNGDLEGGSHGRVHVWVGGNMRDPVIASSDVLFWLHHGEIDRLWDVWQRTHSQGPSLPVGERVMDPYAESVEQLLDVEDLGYAYA